MCNSHELLYDPLNSSILWQSSANWSTSTRSARPVSPSPQHIAKDTWNELHGAQPVKPSNFYQFLVFAFSWIPAIMPYMLSSVYCCSSWPRCFTKRIELGQTGRRMPLKHAVKCLQSHIEGTPQELCKGVALVTLDDPKYPDNFCLRNHSES